MKTKAVRIYGKNDLRLEEFELPPIKDNEILPESYRTVSACRRTKQRYRDLSTRECRMI